MDVSVFRTVAVGAVAENLPIGDKVIAWYPTEWLPMRDNEIASNPEQMTFKTTDIDGVESQGGIITDNTMKATWLPTGSNRLTAPNVRRGERVEILQVADADMYYWRPLGLDDNLRKLETIIWGISATPNEGDTVLSPENMYWFELSSHTKKFSFSSSKANGEPYLYECFFDFATGEFQLTDDIGNFINLVSKLSLIHAQNDKGAFFKLDKKDIKAYAPQDIIADAARDVTVNSGRNMMLKAAVKATINGGGSFIELTAAKTTIRTPKLDGGT